MKQNPDIKFYYADINCRFKINWIDESIDDEFLSSMNELEEILGNHKMSMKLFKVIVEFVGIYSSIL